MRRILILAIVLLSCNIYSSDFKSDFLNVIGKEGEIVEKIPYSKAIKELYLAKDSNNNFFAGAAVREFKSYKKVTAFIVIKKENNTYKVVKSIIPDAEKVGKEKYIAKVKSVAADFMNKTIKEENSDIVQIDATAGATKYHKKAYLTFNLLAEKIVAEIEALNQK